VGAGVVGLLVGFGVAGTGALLGLGVGMGVGFLHLKRIDSGQVGMLQNQLLIFL
jgi:hypothetical protein